MNWKSFFAGLAVSATAMAGGISDYAGMSFERTTAVPFRKVDFFFRADFTEDDKVWDKKTLRNYRDLLEFQFNAEKYGRRGLLVTGGKERTETDTAWEIFSRKQPYTGQAGRFVLEVNASTDVDLSIMRLDEGYSTSVTWYDAADQKILTEKVRIGGLPGRYVRSRGIGRIPEGAASYVVSVGFDTPNVDVGHYFVISDLALGVLPDNAPLVPEWYMTTAPKLVDSDRNISWEADVPKGGKLQFQIAEAENKNDAPAEWSDFHGPDGTAKSFYTTPIQATKPWVKLKLCFSSDGIAEPKLTAITINGKRDCSWYVKPFIFSPVIENLTVSPTLNRREDIVLAVSCEDPINWPSFTAAIDGEDATARFIRKGNLLTCKADKDYADGIHKIALTLESMNGRVTKSEKYLVLGKSPEVDKITLRDDGMTLVNGKPFFPIGPYSVWKREFNNNSFDKAFADLKAAGFNFAHTYNGGPDMKEFLDTAHKYGFKLWIRAHKPLEGDFMKVRFHHPAILAWYIGDDTSANTTPAELQDRHDAMKALDDNRITTQADGVASNGCKSSYEFFVSGSDNFLPEIYPVHKDTPEDRASSVAWVITDMMTVSKNIADSGLKHPKSIWPIIQYFDGWGGWRRFPEDNELRAMSYASIIHGATGITWYTYGGYWDEKNKRYNHGITSTPERWKAISTVATQLNELSPVLTERLPQDQPPVPEILSGPKFDAQSHPAVTCMMKRHDGATYVFAVNSTLENIQAAIRLPKLAGGDVLYENRQIALKDGKLIDSFAPYAVHVYRLK